MRHYQFLDPEVKRRAREHGLDLEKSTNDFLHQIRTGHDMRPDCLEKLAAVVGGRSPLSAAEVDKLFGY